MKNFHVLEKKLTLEINDSRPEDLLSVIEVDNESDVEIKEEPVEAPTVIEAKNEYAVT